MFCNYLFAAPVSVTPCTASTWVGFRVGKFSNAASCKILGVRRFQRKSKNYDHSFLPVRFFARIDYNPNSLRY